MDKITDFFKGAISELKKVVWPTRNEALKITVIVIIFSAIVAIILGSLDYIFTQSLRFLIEWAGK